MTRSFGYYPKIFIFSQKQKNFQSSFTLLLGLTLLVP